MAPHPHQFICTTIVGRQRQRTDGHPIPMETFIWLVPFSLHCKILARQFIFATKNTNLKSRMELNPSITIHLKHIPFCFHRVFLNMAWKHYWLC